MRALEILAAITLGSLLAFALVWTAMTIGNKRTRQRQSLGQRLAYMVPTIVGVLLVVGPAWNVETLEPLAGRVIPATLVWYAASAVLAVAGAGLAIWSRLTLGRNWSGMVTLKEGHTLVTSGPYAHIRHPIYTAVTMLLLGLYLLFGTAGGALGLPFVVLGFWIKLRQEEKLMLAEFPDAYPAYMARTMRLLPYLV